MRAWIFLGLLTSGWAAASPLGEWLEKAPAERGPLPSVVLTQGQAETFRDRLAGEILAEIKQQRAAEVEAKSITLGDKALKWLEKDFNLAPEGERSLWISMHGGGGAPAAVNDQQWQNQIRLYQPEEGIYVAPRAPTNTWNLWHEGHIDPLLDRLIADMVAVRGVHPDKVYLMGYSAGGDGVWQLAPRMADRFAAAAMMAGHPNDASLLPLRNLPFGVFVGSEDAAYDRNTIDARKGEELAALHQADPQGYENLVRVYEGLPHWMDGKDKEAVPWMAKYVRKSWPKKIVWVQDDITHDRFYWLEIPAGAAKAGQQIVATVEGNQIKLDGDVPDTIALHLADSLVDLDQPVRVEINGKEIFSGKVDRSAAAIFEGLSKLPDASRCGYAILRVRQIGG
ncbi:MAG: alpha/beta hydrolase [Verrucomicrobiota bacterium]